MDQVTQTKVLFRRVQWRKIIAECQVSGIPVKKLPLSRATMANWIIRCSDDYFKPIIDHLQQKLLDRAVVHCDETSVQVLKEEGKKQQTRSYMWLYRTGNDGKEPIVLYDYQPSRNGDNAVNFLKNFKRYVHSDGYSGYNKL